MKILPFKPEEAERGTPLCLSTGVPVIYIGSYIHERTREMFFVAKQKGTIIILEYDFNGKCTKHGYPNLMLVDTNPDNHNYNPKSAWELNLKNNVRWLSEDTHSDVCFLVKNWLSEIASEEGFVLTPKLLKRETEGADVISNMIKDGNINVILDTSGLLLTQLPHVLSKINMPEDVLYNVIQCSSFVERVDIVESFENVITPPLKGGVGSDMMKAFDLIAQDDNGYDLYNTIFITDSYNDILDLKKISGSVLCIMLTVDKSECNLISDPKGGITFIHIDNLK